MKILYLMDQMHTHGGGEKILSLKMVLPLIKKLKKK